MSVVFDLGDSHNPLRFVYWYEFAAFTVAMSLGFLALRYLFEYLG